MLLSGRSILAPPGRDREALLVDADREAPPPGTPKSITLSVVMPVYNERATAAEAIERVLKLDLADVAIELIVVESNSTDGSREIVEVVPRHARRDGRAAGRGPRQGQRGAGGLRARDGRRSS